MLTRRSIPTQLSVRLAGDTSSQTPSGQTPSGMDVDLLHPSRVATLTYRARVVDRLVAETLRPLALPCLRILLGLLFIWFGGLKVAGDSPVKALVAGTLPWADPNVIVPLLGGAEVLLGLALVTGVALRLALPALAAHLGGTFLTFVMLPAQMFQHSNPLLLTENGEFVTKNLVLISATMVLIAHTSRAVPARIPRPGTPA
jgi:putative oxidoreductase